MKGFREYINNFGILKEDTFTLLKGNFKQRQLSSKEIFANEEEFSSKVGFIEEGIVRSYIRNEEGKEYTKQFFIAPSIIGAYSSLITKRPNRIIQQALTECKVWTADYKDIEELYSQYHEMERIGRKIAEFYYLEKEQHILEMALYDAKKRYSNLKYRFPDIESKVQQYLIASYLGISATQLSRIRKKLKNV